MLIKLVFGSSICMSNKLTCLKVMLKEPSTTCFILCHNKEICLDLGVFALWVFFVVCTPWTIVKFMGLEKSLKSPFTSLSIAPSHWEQPVQRSCRSPDVSRRMCLSLWISICSSAFQRQCGLSVMHCHGDESGSVQAFHLVLCSHIPFSLIGWMRHCLPDYPHWKTTSSSATVK